MSAPDREKEILFRGTLTDGGGTILCHIRACPFFDGAVLAPVQTSQGIVLKENQPTTSIKINNCMAQSHFLSPVINLTTPSSETCTLP